MTFYYLSEELDKDSDFKLEFMEADGDVIKTFTNKKDRKNPHLFKYKKRNESFCMEYEIS
ncbi:MAG: hypothetical protein CM1200mP1_15340 [Candidatus Neomarinimicrobiota bacterium]|nr:MAG: hypothetical protein CM1200mP1_15340 [Candidatus Neomarinimicrobiota bacterium]